MKMEGELFFGIGDGMTDLVRDTFWFEQRFDWSKGVLDCFRGISEEQKDKILIGDAFIKPVEEGVKVVFEKDMKFKNELKQHINFVKLKMERLNKEIYKSEADIEKEECRFTGTDIEVVDELKQSLKQFEMERKSYEELLRYYNNLFFEKVKVDTTINIGGFEVSMYMLEEYAEEVVKRLRAVMRNPAYAQMQNPLEILRLERRREELHKRILEAIGIEERKGDKYMRFDEALEKYLEEMGAGLFR